jgi:hypothetical protein
MTLQALYSQGKILQYSLARRLGGPQVSLNMVVKGKISATIGNQTLVIQPMTGMRVGHGTNSLSPLRK